MYIHSTPKSARTDPAVQPEKGGDINVVKESQKKRNASVELVDEVMALFNEHKEGKLPIPGRGAAADNLANYNSENLRREVNALIKEIGQIKRNKGNADELIAKKAEMDKEVAALTVKANELVKKRDGKAFLLGNIVDKNSAVSTTEGWVLLNSSI